MQVLEKTEKIFLSDNFEINSSDKEKIMISKNNYKNTGKSYSINDAYNLGLTKLKF